MIERMLLVMVAVTLAACASTGGDTAPIVEADGAQAEAVAAATTENEFDFADAPQAEQVAAADVEPEDEIVCRREKPAGSNLSRKVCFKRSQIEGRSAQDQETMRQIRSLKPSSSQEFNQQ